MLSGLDASARGPHPSPMKKQKAAVRPAQALSVHRLGEQAQIVLSDAETALLVVRGACKVRTPLGELERIEAGSVLVREKSAHSELDRPIARALAALQREPERAWTVERLARSVGLSRAAFARRFVAALGCSPARYLTDLRLALAASLLENSDASLAEIASRVGYLSEFAFSRAFKRRHGVAPGSFRRLRARPSTRISLLAA